jgi:hypothetical protein
MQDEILTADNKSIKLNIQHAILIKECNSTEDILKLKKQALEKGCEISEFTKEMLETTDDRKVIEITKQLKEHNVIFNGLIIFGEKKIVDEITAGCSLYS